MNPRYFVGIFPPAKVGDELARAADALETHLPDTRLRKTHAEDIHLTLRFIGELPEDKLSDLKQALAEVAKSWRPFELRPAGIGGFPSCDRARVVWAGVDDEAARTLVELAYDIEDAVVGLSLKRERRPFVAHFTLARARNPVSVEGFESGPDRFSAFEVGGIELACNPSPGLARREDVPIYERLEEFTFGTSGDAGDG